MGMRAVTEGLFGDGEQDKFAVLHASDFALGDTEFGWIDEIVSGVDVHDMRLNLFKLCRGVVISRGIDGVEKIVGVDRSGDACHGGGEIFVSSIARRQIFLHVQRSAAGDDQKIAGDLQAPTRLFSVCLLYTSRCV